jgi:hypothetical protein
MCRKRNRSHTSKQADELVAPHSAPRVDLARCVSAQAQRKPDEKNAKAPRSVTQELSQENNLGSIMLRSEAR